MSDEAAALRVEFLRLLTTDSVTKDRRRRDFNQAIFNPEGWAIWSSTDLEMVMSQFDKAVARLRSRERCNGPLIGFDGEPFDGRRAPPDFDDYDDD